MLISPAEPREFLVLGLRSPVPETYGADFLSFPQGKTLAVQRKECSDLIASMRSDDRLARELHQLKEADRAVLIIEGRWAWRNGESTRQGCQGVLKAQVDGIILSLQANNVWVLTTDNIPDTIATLQRIERYFEKDTHDSLFRRPKSRGLWGTWHDRDWACHVLSGWDGLSTVRAGALYDQYGLPLRWSITREEMLTVPGIGAGTADRLWRSLPQPDD